MTTEENAPPTTYFPSMRRTLLVALGSIALVVGSALLLVEHASLGHSAFKGVVAGVFGVLFFGFCACVSVGRLLRRRPELVLSSGGLTHGVLGSIAWIEIAEVGIREIKVRSHSERVIELVLHDPAAYLARAPRTARIAGAVALRMGYSPANISVGTLPVGLDEVLAAMRRHHPELTIRE
ncbi:hypothetical protein IPZ61_00155 [Streptomyces sioyaensis]|uniref:STM3941 family protein n=1 Tax=Streptomyces sioyaensis TaxID=67364 RepID=UPI001F3E418B|nr:STM3941 family protein [Streptomyces sioyaensis]MCF3171762.1 hypothetical protein [Streptomyces sioyaensis]